MEMGLGLSLPWLPSGRTDVGFLWHLLAFSVKIVFPNVGSIHLQLEALPLCYASDWLTFHTLGTFPVIIQCHPSLVSPVVGVGLSSVFLINPIPLGLVGIVMSDLLPLPQL